jgi:hypothetical protein
LGLPTLAAALQEEPALTLRFFSYGIVSSKRTTNGLVEHAVSPEDVAAALSDTVVFDTGLLTADTLCVRSEGATRTVAEYRRPQKTALWLEGSDDPVRVPLPGLVLIRKTTANAKPDYQLYAVASRPASYDAPLYHAPLPNIYKSGGVCWGTVTKVRDLNTTSLAADFTQLFSTAFGNHSCGGKCVSFPRDVRKLYFAMEERRTRVYSKKELVTAKRTLGGVLGVGI